MSHFALPSCVLEIFLESYQMGYNDTGNAMQPDVGRRRHPNRTKSADWSVATAESYGDYSGSSDDGDSTEGARTARPRRTRYRRRGSVTKYSLDTAETVKHEYEATTRILNQYRQQGRDGATPTMPNSTDFPIPNATDFPIPSNTPQEVQEAITMEPPTSPVEGETSNDMKKMKKKGLLRRFTMR